MKKEEGEERLLVPALKHDGVPVVDDLERTEDPELHEPGPTVTPAVLQANRRVGFDV